MVRLGKKTNALQNNVLAFDLRIETLKFSPHLQITGILDLTQNNIPN